jgi:hypothetical protein
LSHRPDRFRILGKEAHAMNSTLSLTLILALINSPLPAVAQTASIGRAVAQEALRLGSEPVKDDANWSRVRKLQPGTEIVLSSRVASGPRYILAADEASVTMLNLASSMLPAAATEALRNLASSNPAHLTAAEDGGGFLLERDVRLQALGVFVGSQRVADINTIIERIKKSDVAEIKIERLKGRPVIGALIGLAGGIALGAWRTNNVQCPERNFSNCLITDTALVPLLSAAGGAAVGASVGRHKTEELIYRAP